MVPSPEIDTDDPYDRASSNSLLFIDNKRVYGLDSSSIDVGATDDNNEGEMVPLVLVGASEVPSKTDGVGGLDDRMEEGLLLPNAEDNEAEGVGPIEDAGIWPGGKEMDDAGPFEDDGIPGAVGRVSAKLVGPTDAAGIWPGGEDVDDAGPIDEDSIPGMDVAGKVLAKLVGPTDAAGI